ncbi:hypothetical protein MRB53_040865 [Persea americana]|nr:hypothetical protein MRB53_040865 [Persea americana]
MQSLRGLLASTLGESVSKGKDIDLELQLPGFYTPPKHDDEKHYRWVRVTARPSFVNGKIAHVLGVATEISELKWAASVQRRSAMQASEAKKRQEDFIDISKWFVMLAITAATDTP